MAGLKICTRCRAISARRNRRISSSLLPENIGPTTTSIQPMLPLTMSTLRLLQICRSEHRSLFERGEEPAVSPAQCKNQIPHPQETRVRVDSEHRYPAACAAGRYIFTLQNAANSATTPTPNDSCPQTRLAPNT